MRLFLSFSTDGFILIWSSAGGIVDKISLGAPIHCMTMNFRRHQLVCGSKTGIRIYRLDKGKACGHVINPAVVYIAKDHTDIVRAVVCHESRIYSGGFDHRLIIYELSYTDDTEIRPLVIKYNAHDAGITCVVPARDSENNFWIVTGSFDKTVKIWSVDGIQVHKMDNFLAPISSICYCTRDKTIWVSAGLSSACLFEPKSGDNVTDSVGTFQQPEEERYHLQLIKYVPELNEVVGSTSRKHLIVWKYNPSGCVTALKARNPLESLCFTSKDPILYFSGDNKGTVTKWERMQSNFFIYSKEEYGLNDIKIKQNGQYVAKTEERDNDFDRSSSRSKTSRNPRKPVHTSYRFRQHSITPASSLNSDHTAIIKVTFVESLDLLVAGCEDGKIYIWGFDVTTAEELRKVVPKKASLADTKYAVLLDAQSELLKNKDKPSDSDANNNRVADFVCMHIFEGHQNCVTSFIVVDRKQGYNGTFLVSGGWDCKLCIWNLETGKLHDVYRSLNKSSRFIKNFIPACDGAILDMDYSPLLNEFAYGSSDSMAYIRKFSTNGFEMALQNTLQGHEGDVVAIKWNPFVSKWITAAEDGIIHIWSSTGLNECEQVLSAHGSLYCLTIDGTNGNIIAGVHNTIKVFDIETFCVVQVNVGHTDIVKCIVHVPSRNQYVSCSWDQTVRVWNAWRKKYPKSPNKSGLEPKIIETKEKER